jgi:hypothetical protein
LFEKVSSYRLYSIVMAAKPVSKFSATMIGTVDPSTDRHHAAREVYKREAQDISKSLEANHYSRRLKNMQVYYPDTITKLSHVPAAPPAPSPAAAAGPGHPAHTSQSSK